MILQFFFSQIQEMNCWTYKSVSMVQKVSVDLPQCKSSVQQNNLRHKMYVYYISIITDSTWNKSSCHSNKSHLSLCFGWWCQHIANIQNIQQKQSCRTHYSLYAFLREMMINRPSQTVAGGRHSPKMFAGKWTTAVFLGQPVHWAYIAGHSQNDSKF